MVGALDQCVTASVPLSTLYSVKGATRRSSGLDVHAHLVVLGASCDVASAAPSTQAAEVEDIIARIVSHKGVEGVVVCTYDGVPLRSTLPREASVQLAGLYAALASKVRGTVRIIDAEVRRVAWSWEQEEPGSGGGCGSVPRRQAQNCSGLRGHQQSACGGRGPRNILRTS